MARHVKMPALLESVDGDDCGSNSMSISCPDELQLYTASTGKVMVFIRAAISFVENQMKLAAFNAPIFTTG